MEDRRADISNALQAWIVDKCRNLNILDVVDGKTTVLGKYKESSNRLSLLIEQNLIPYVRRDKNQDIVFFRQITTDLESRFGVKHLDLPSLADAIPNARYGKLQDGYKMFYAELSRILW
jgi:hypothetical protein